MSEYAKLKKDFDTLRRAVAYALEKPGMYEEITRPSGSVNGGSIRAGRWWWVLRGAIECTWGRHGPTHEALTRGDAPWDPAGSSKGTGSE